MRVLIYGLAKSGTTVLHLKIKRAMEAKYSSSVSEVFEATSREGDTLYKLDKSSYKIGEHAIVKSLLPGVEGMGVSPDTIIDDYADFDKKIFIVRDPRDRWISDFFYRWYHLHKPKKEEFEIAHRLTQHKEAHPQDLPFYTLFTTNPVRFVAWKERQTKLHARVQKFLTEAKKNDWFVVKYEDIMDGNLDELEKYLGFAIHESDPTDKRFTHVARSKKHGNWRRWFTKDDVEFYRPLYTEYMEFNGYDTEDWKLTPVDHLPPSEGSDYMMKLFTGHHGKPKAKRWTEKLFGK